MPIFTTLRQSPTYLYIKVYCICTLVTLFQAAPVSSRIPKIGQRLQLSKYHIINTRLGPRIVPIEQALTIGHVPATKQSDRVHFVQESNDAVPPSSHEIVISPDLLGLKAAPSRIRSIAKRWSQRARDLAQVRRLLRTDDADVKTYPELNWDAHVRRSSSLHSQEVQFIEKRRQRMSSAGSDHLRRFLDLPSDEAVNPDDVPLIGLGGSGGGYRAMYGYTGFLSAAKASGLWDCITWVAGVSGSCWTLAAYYTIAYQNVDRLTKHYLATAGELAHPMSVYALDTVARSSRGIYFLLGPLIRKAQAGIVGLGMMDLYATLTTTYQLLSREPRARLSRATFQFSKVWKRSGISQGHEPMPIFTAVRVAPKNAEGVRPHTDSSLSKGQPPKRALVQHQTAASRALSHRDSSLRATSAEKSTSTSAAAVQTADPLNDILGEPVARGYFQWFEASPLEVGSADVEAYIPTWAWGRAFVSGRSIDRRPEESLSLILGQCTSAPAGPLTGYISALLASLPRGTAMSRMLLVLNDFVRMKRWERRWGNPIRAGDEPNPFYGLNVRPVPRLPSPSQQASNVLGIGIDILHTPRLDALINRQIQRVERRQAQASGRGDSSALKALHALANRVLSLSEFEEWSSMVSGINEVSMDRAGMAKLKRYLAVRWAAKEAAYKALYPHIVVSWKDLALHKLASSEASFSNLEQLERDDQRTRKPVLSFSEDWMNRHRNTDAAPALHVSISHDGDYVVANVLAERQHGKVDLPEPMTPKAGRKVQLPTFVLQSQQWDDIQVRLPGGTAQSVWAAGQRETASAESSSRSGEGDLANTVADSASGSAEPSWESQGRIRLMDSGMSNNLPNHVLARRERGADIILAFDASSDVQAGSALRRIQNFADDCHIELCDESHLFGVEPAESRPDLSEAGQAIEDRFVDQYARVLRGIRQQDGSEFWLVYCPLLPNAVNPSFDPSTSSFSNSYNLVWTPAQVSMLLTTSQANLDNYALSTIKKVMRHVYARKKAKRQASDLEPNPHRHE
ncbi:FabD/lysophospholipase-like protein [Testicularia cyperi]|uniref:Lysophospholipase n=1 Tax=Testicularia cyperi TaxID=1882483 RepID=A0A317XTQ0_9BASI|nr:FabD/lysophospholipase-like protein [Testicularia cyperi]